MSNDFLAFAKGGSANVISQATYAALTALLDDGFSTGLAESAQLNKVWRQSSIMSAVLAQFIVDISGQNAVDDGTTATLLANLKTAVQPTLSRIAAATGTADALTAVFPTPPTAHVNGLPFYVRATSANATTTPTFTPNAVLPLTPKTIVKGSNTVLAVGDIMGAGHWLQLQYDTALDKYVLLNPATGINMAAYALLGVAQTFTKAQRGLPVVLPALTGSLNIDLSAANNFYGQVTGNLTFSNSYTNAVAGQSGVIRVQQNGSSLYSWAFGSNWKYAGGSGLIPTQTQTLGAYDEIVYYVNSATEISFAVRGNVS